MKICQVDPGCGIPIPPPSWGAIEKIVWEFHNNINKLGHTSQISMAGYIQQGEYDVVHCHVANLVELVHSVDIAYRNSPSAAFMMHDQILSFK